MTALTALERLTTDSVLTVSARAEGRPAFGMGMKAGQQWPLVQVLESLLIVSANDAAYVLAENASGNVEEFSQQMATTGKRLGLRDSTFSDPDGIDSDEFSISGGSRVSAYDLAIIGRNALAVPIVASTAGTVSTSWDDPTGTGRSLHTKNDVFLGRYEGANGLKTGFTEQAGRHLVASATRGDQTLIAVVLGVPDTAAWAGKLLDEGFAAPANAGTETLPEVAVITADTTRSALDGMPRILGRPAMVYAGPAQIDEVEAPSATAQPPAEPSDDGTDTTDTAATAPPASVALAPSLDGTGSAASASESRSVDWRIVTLMVIVVTGLAVAGLRRRAVIRRRRRRLARQRALSEARRRGMIDVIDPMSTGRGHVNVIRDRVSTR
jgi:D-alanyl-D-alanine carboxypeptidase